MRWKHHKAADSFSVAAAEWDILNRAVGNHILLDSKFVAAALRCFGDGNVLLSVDETSPSQAMLLITKKSPGVWETFQPPQAPLGFVLVGPNQNPEHLVQALLSSLPGPAMQFAILQQDPDFSFFPKASGSPQVEVVEYIQTPRLKLAGTFEEYWTSRSKNLRHNLARQRKRLTEQQRRLELLVFRQPVDIAAAVRDFGRLESAGWKGREGTAIAENNVQGKFYRQIFEEFCANDEGVVYQLHLDGKMVASDMCLARNGMLVVLKTAYDESIQQLSPALLMREEIIRLLYQEDSIKVIEFYGKVLDWHLKWSDQVRTMYHVNCFRHRLIAKARDLIKRL